jgi:hypothetical protein
LSTIRPTIHVKAVVDNAYGPGNFANSSIRFNQVNGLKGVRQVLKITPL